MTLTEILNLTSCATCAHYDGDGFCALPDGDKLINGYIEEANSVICIEWTKPEPEVTDGRQ